MKKFFAVLVILLVIAGVWIVFFKPKKPAATGPKQQPLTVSKHTDTFNISAQRMITDYYSISEGFVVWDTAAVSKSTHALQNSVSDLRLDQIRQDTVIYQTALSIRENVKAEIEGILKDPSLEEKRLGFNSLTQYVYDLLRTVRYDQSKIYFQECPMAFGEEQPGNWLSSTTAVRNPYLGTQHPKYKDGMLHCGGPKDTLNFLVTGSLKN